MKALFTLTLILFLGCTSATDVAQAEQYQLELQYYQYAIDFATRGMGAEAVGRCHKTTLLRSECFTSLAQILPQHDAQLDPSYCQEIHPEERLPLTNRALGIVYRDLDSDLAQELKTKMNPTPERIAMLQAIKEECLKSP